MTVSCSPQWTHTSTSAHDTLLLLKWRQCSRELSKDRLVLMNSRYLSIVVKTKEHTDTKHNISLAMYNTVWCMETRKRHALHG